MKTIKLDRWNISQYDDPSPFILESEYIKFAVILPDGDGECFFLVGDRLF